MGESRNHRTTWIGRGGRPASFLAAALLAGGSLTATAHARENPPAERKVSLLYVVESGSGRLDPVPGTKARFKLTMRPLARRAFWFTDRPARRSGSFPSRALASSWTGFGFKADPPNAAIVYETADGERGTAIAELRRPRYGRKSRALSISARLIGADEVQRTTISGHASAADRTPERALRSVSLFIDDATAPVLDGCVLQPATQCVGAGFDLSGADLEGANLWSANLRGANLSGADLSGATLQGAIMAGAELGDADLSGANASWAYLDSVTSKGADFGDANLSHASLTGAELIDADLVGANLAQANLSYADLTGAKVTYGSDSSLRQATMCGMTAPNGYIHESC